jgi:hypothetical protein
MILGAFMLIPTISAEESVQIPQSCIDGNVDIPLRERIVNYWIWRRDALLRKFIRNGSYKLLEGTVSAVTRNILVIESEDKTINVISPGKWVYNGNILSIQDLFDSDPFNMGDTVILETLMLKLEKDDQIVTSYLTLTVSVGENTVSALLPFNVEPVE